MPSKRPPPLENPPSASDSSSDSSTEEEEVEDTPEDEHQKQQVVRTPLKFSLKKPNSNSNSNPPPSSAPKPPSDSSDEESESADSDSDSDVPPQNHAPALDVKPISSKPMLQSEAPDGAASGSVKRRLETEEKDSRKDQKKKKKVSDLGAEEEESGKKSGEDPKKLFQRLWTDQDEIVILKGMVNFKKKGKDPSAQVSEFFDSIKHLLRPDVNKVQLHGKIRTIRRKYHNALKKVKKTGEDPEFSKPHDAKVYQLSKKVWSEGGSKDDQGETMNVDIVVAKADGEKTKTKRVTEGVSASASKPKATTLPDSSPVVAEKEDLENVSEYTYLNASLLPRDFLMMPVPAPGLGEVFHKKGWNLMGCSNAAGFDKRWKSVMIAETKAYLQRIDLVREQTQAMLDALESSDL